MQQLLLLLLAGLANFHVGIVQAFRDGDFIQSARKSQFHGQRTHWHDLLGHHCPRYGHQRLVAMPLQKPIANFTGDDDYKIQLSFDGGCFSWFPASKP
ncbi:hypothetical protein DUNSADRAFT_892 [Dunaliella salina]|uniref:Secreted protein n=1 Tax=Dunaliella salina TaxID=3046 RepID=A0ABQ7H8N3_DUNSA|nr:hypothetical protein DUNSADRAFT_892 [Dunaliella salina]|eukprot:KAF5843216.1 hypothetical protein DUNSADRAFT_892 [Dunaliella salina]